MFKALSEALNLSSPLLTLFWMAKYFEYEIVSNVLICLWLVALGGGWVLFYTRDPE